MAKTYNTISTFTSGQVLTAVQMNEIGTNVNNYRVPPMARILLSTSVSVANGSHTDFTGFTSTNGTEDIDTDGMVTLSGTASAITIQTAGVYVCQAMAVWPGNATGQRLVRIVRSRSGTLVPVSTQQQVNSGATVPMHMSTGGLISCAVGDLIRMMVYQSSGGALNLLNYDTAAEYGQTFLSATWVGQAS